MECRCAATVVIKEVCLHAKQRDFTVFKFICEHVDVICEIDMNCENHVSYEGKRKALCLTHQKTLYVALNASIFWHDFLPNTLLDN